MCVGDRGLYETLEGVKLHDAKSTAGKQGTINVTIEPRSVTSRAFLAQPAGRYSPKLIRCCLSVVQAWRTKSFQRGGLTGG